MPGRMSLLAGTAAGTQYLLYIGSSNMAYVCLE